MKVINETVWNTAHLRAILQQAAKRELEPAKRRTIVITVSYTRGAESSGCAYVGGNHATVRIQHPSTRSRWHNPEAEALTTAGAELKARFASVASHEFAHLRGMQHRQMPAYYGWSGSWREYVVWAEALPLDVQEQKRQPKPTDDAKLVHVQTMMRRAESRLKRATTLLKKWKVKARYYERKMAAKRPT